MCYLYNDTVQISYNPHNGIGFAQSLGVTSQNKKGNAAAGEPAKLTAGKPAKLTAGKPAKLTAGKPASQNHPAYMFFQRTTENKRPTIVEHMIMIRNGPGAPPKNKSGFTIIELAITLMIIGIMASIAIPSFSVWLPSYRLKSAARELYSNLQLAKLTAVRQNQNCSITFSTSPDQYVISGVTKTVVLADYGSGVKFDDPTHSKTFETSPLTFNARGLSNSGYVYLSNDKNSAYYRATPLTSGAIKLEKWDGSDFE